MISDSDMIKGIKQGDKESFAASHMISSQILISS